MRVFPLMLSAALIATLLVGCSSTTPKPATITEYTPAEVSDIYATIPVPATTEATGEPMVEKPFVVGAVYGSGVGKPLGDELDESTRAIYWRAQNISLSNGTDEEWVNDERGDHGRFISGDEYARNESFCRKFTSEVWINGVGQHLKGVACQNTNGSWSPE